MKINDIPFGITDWSKITPTRKSGISGFALWQTQVFSDIRVRIVEYSPNYEADHWCKKGHIVHCLEGEFVTELENGEKTKLTKGMSYIVSDNLSSHRSISKNGVKLLIIDGDFLKH
jgi:mannose-6-phosphate isomerase class I